MKRDLATQLLSTPDVVRNKPWWLRISAEKLARAKKVHAFYKAGKYPNHTLDSLALAVGQDLGITIAERSLRRFFQWAEREGAADATEGKQKAKRPG